jgi:hypothetical protein
MLARVEGAEYANPAHHGKDPPSAPNVSNAAGVAIAHLRSIHAE